MKNFDPLNAASFEQATQELKSSKRGQPIAGGTDLLGTLKKNILPESPDLMVNLKTIPNASYVLDQGDKVAVGALTTLSEVESDSAFAGAAGTTAIPIPWVGASCAPARAATSATPFRAATSTTPSWAA